MKINCVYSQSTEAAKVKFSDIPENIIGADFLLDCLAEIDREYNRICGITFSPEEVSNGE